jgi:hypothetical protein
MSQAENTKSSVGHIQLRGLITPNQRLIARLRNDFRYPAIPEPSLEQASGCVADKRTNAQVSSRL